MIGAYFVEMQVEDGQICYVMVPDSIMLDLGKHYTVNGKMSCLFSGTEHEKHILKAVQVTLGRQQVSTSVSLVDRVEELHQTINFKGTVTGELMSCRGLRIYDLEGTFLLSADTLELGPVMLENVHLVGDESVKKWLGKDFILLACPYYTSIRQSSLVKPMTLRTSDEAIKRLFIKQTLQQRMRKFIRNEKLCFGSSRMSERFWIRLLSVTGILCSDVCCKYSDFFEHHRYCPLLEALRKLKGATPSFIGIRKLKSLMESMQRGYMTRRDFEDKPAVLCYLRNNREHYRCMDDNDSIDVSTLQHEEEQVVVINEWTVLRWGDRSAFIACSLQKLLSVKDKPDHCGEIEAALLLNWNRVHVGTKNMLVMQTQASPAALAVLVEKVRGEPRVGEVVHIDERRARFCMPSKSDAEHGEQLTLIFRTEDAHCTIFFSDANGDVVVFCDAPMRHFVETVTVEVCRHAAMLPGTLFSVVNAEIGDDRRLLSQLFTRFQLIGVGPFDPLMRSARQTKVKNVKNAACLLVVRVRAVLSLELQAICKTCRRPSASKCTDHQYTQSYSGRLVGLVGDDTGDAMLEISDIELITALLPNLNRAIYGKSIVSYEHAVFQNNESLDEQEMFSEMPLNHYVVLVELAKLPENDRDAFTVRDRLFYRHARLKAVHVRCTNDIVESERAKG